MEDIIARIRRTSKLGQLGEVLAAESLTRNGFSGVKNLNEGHNHPYADLIAERDGVRYFIGVKSRNEERDVGGLNSSYNCVLVRDVVNRRLKEEGKTVDQITRMALQEVFHRAKTYGAVPAWIAVPMRPARGMYAAYFGVLSDLGNKRSIPMSIEARKTYTCLTDWTRDARITIDLSNNVTHQK